MSRHYDTGTRAWVKLPIAALREHGLHKSDAVVLSIIIDECVAKPDGAPITRAELSAATGYSPRQITDSIKTLTALELISVTQTGRAPLYRLLKAVELLPEQPSKPKPSKSKGKGKELTAQEQQELEEYLALVNRFPAAYGAGRKEDP